MQRWEKKDNNYKRNLELEKERKKQPLKNNFKDNIELDDTAHDSQQL